MILYINARLPGTAIKGTIAEVISLGRSVAYGITCSYSGAIRKIVVNGSDLTETGKPGEFLLKGAHKWRPQLV